MTLREEREFIAECNKEPVLYCKNCLSLRILNVCDQDYCDVCGSDDIGTAQIEEWEQMCIEKYGHKLY